MNIKELTTIKQVLEADIELAEDALRMAYNDNDKPEMVYWAERLAASLQAHYTVANLIWKHRGE